MALVIGLSSSGAIHALHRLLAQAELPTDSLQAIDPADAPSGLTHGMAGSGLLEPDGGTGIPGMNNRMETAFSDDSMSARLDELEIPQSAAGNYAEALERGHSVVSYVAKAADAERVEAIFRDAGISNVRRF